MIEKSPKVNASMNRTKNDLNSDQRKKVVTILNQQLVDLINLQLQAKQAHWNVKGPHFIGLHKLFDEVAEAIEPLVDEVAEAIAPLVDEVAERAAALGGLVDGTVEGVAKKTTLEAYPNEIVDGRDHVEALSSALAAAGKQVREAIDETDKLGDADTADLLTDVSRVLDKKLWFVEAHLQGGP
jgi:starvation-inducible DNA-binding protein